MKCLQGKLCSVQNAPFRIIRDPNIHTLKSSNLTKWAKKKKSKKQVTNFVIFFRVNIKMKKITLFSLLYHFVIIRLMLNN